MVIDQSKMCGVGDGLDEGDDRADENHEHDGVLHLHPGVELLQRIHKRVPEDLAVEEAPGLGHPVGSGARLGLRLCSQGCGH